MAIDMNRARAVHFTRMQEALEEGLKAIEAARTPAEADTARARAQQRIEHLNKLFNEAFAERNA